ncbi:MAG: COG1361 S-layer family protein [Eubacteriales bacterium]
MEKLLMMRGINMKKWLLVFLTIGLIILTMGSVQAAPKSPEVVISKYTIDAKTITPGSTFKVTLNMKNHGEYHARKINITLKNEQGQENLGSFSPVNQSNVQYVSIINAGKSKDVSFNLYVSPKIEPGNYNILVNFSYMDYNGVIYEETQTIGLLIKEKEGVMLIGETDLGKLVPGTPMEMEMQIVNNGSSQIKGVNAYLEGEGIDGQAEYFGNFESGDYDIYIFNLEENNPGKHTSKIVVEYTNSLNEASKVEKELTYTVMDDEELQDNTENSKESENWFVKFLKGIFGL